MNQHIREALEQIHELDKKFTEIQLAVGSMQRAISIQKTTLLNLQVDVENDVANSECRHITNEQLEQRLKEISKE